MLLALSWDAELALGLSVVATVIAVISALYAHRADKRAGRAERRAERAESRDEERIERERKEAEAANRASLKLWFTGSQATPDQLRVGYRIANNGQAIAHNVHVWLRDKSGKDVSMSEQATFDLAPDQSDDTRGVPVPLDLAADDLRFSVGWFDGGGPQVWPTDIAPF